VGIEAMPIDVLRKLVKEISDAKAVDWNPEFGGVCPVCGEKRCRVTSSIPWTGKIRERYHKCRSCSHRFKSIQCSSH